jgi:uncharacterized membrane protein
MQTAAIPDLERRYVFILTVTDLLPCVVCTDRQRVTRIMIGLYGFLLLMLSLLVVVVVIVVVYDTLVNYRLYKM